MDIRPRLLDLFSGAGGAAVGYHQAGFDVVGVDIDPQPHYPFDFIKADALDLMDGDGWRGFDAIHASPPCQRWIRGLAVMNNATGRAQKSYPDLIDRTRALLAATGLPTIIENIPTAPVRRDITLCGQAFGLRVIRHRCFESNLLIPRIPHRRHEGHTSTSMLAAYHTLEKATFVTVVGHLFRLADGRKAMGIDWMTRDELAQAIPPAYTHYIGGWLMRYLKHEQF